MDCLRNQITNNTNTTNTTTNTTTTTNTKATITVGTVGVGVSVCVCVHVTVAWCLTDPIMFVGLVVPSTLEHYTTSNRIKTALFTKVDLFDACSALREGQRWVSGG